MRARYLWMALGMTFVVTLAVIVGQRLSSEAMAVMVGVVAGVGASIPTSLIVVWFATRSTLPRPAPEPIGVNERAEPRVVIMAPPSAAIGAPAQASYPSYSQHGYLPYSAPPALPPRQFTVIGGAEVSLDEAQASTEVVWQR